jgi:glycosyltransferase involved in cell wall biosynthesis
VRVLIQNRPDAFTVPGGDTVQMERTAAGLRELGIEVDVRLEPRPALEGYDLVHLFNLNRADATAIQARHAHEHGVPFVLTPLHQLMERYDREGRPGGLKHLYRVAPGLMSRLRSAYLRRPHREGDKAWVVGRAAAILPSSDLEAEQVTHDFGPTAPLVPVPNGVELDETPAEDRSGVLCVGRIEPFKNQIALIEALAGTGIRIRLAGAVSPRHPRWARHCLRALERTGGEYMGRLDRPELAQAYASAEVLVLPSWFEAAPLSCLEAAWHGCRVVCTSVGYARAYLQDDAEYCDPADRDSIRRAVEAALTSPPPAALRERIRVEYTWKRAAEETLRAYRLVARDARR